MYGKYEPPEVLLVDYRYDKDRNVLEDSANTRDAYISQVLPPAHASKAGGIGNPSNRSHSSPVVPWPAHNVQRDLQTKLPAKNLTSQPHHRFTYS